MTPQGLEGAIKERGVRSQIFLTPRFDVLNYKGI
jgi:hypothetical protein